MIHRRQFVLGGAAIVATVACQARPSNAPWLNGPGLAVTIDDFAWSEGPLLTPLERDRAIRAALGRYKLQAAAFPKGTLVASTEVGTVLEAWANAGHVIGNHTMNHPYFGDDDAKLIMADVLAAEQVLKRYSTFKKWLRFPYLAEGKTAQNRDEMRLLLAEHEYTNAHITVDSSDWYINQRLVQRLSDEPSADVSAYRQYYLDHLWDRATYYNELAEELTKRADIQHTLLLHHNLLNALFLDDALAMFAKRGWRLVDVEAAYEDPLFDASPKSLPSGQSLIWSMAKETQRYDSVLRYPGEGKRYEEAEMTRLGL